VAKPVAPLLSFGASGQIGKSMVFSKWRGQSYVRGLVTPANPQTAEQSLTRNTFAWLQAVWKIAPALFADPWFTYAAGKPLTDRNAFAKFNNGVLRTETDLSLMVFSPGALGGLPPATITVTGGADQVTVACTAPGVLPVGWSIVGALLGIIKDQEPGVGVDYDITMVEDDVAPYSNVFAVPAAAADWVGFAYLKWLRPDGKFAYSPSLSDQASST